MRRRHLLATAAAAVAAPALATGARAQAFPSKPIRILIPFAPGGTSDILPACCNRICRPPSASR